ncbi:MAG: P-loop NTPase, partial [Acutalibacteraceae bacterium]|nr:P-loop NTPase [Acutalibacteraceae bacterium]
MIDINSLERITIVCGHYGSGKTNFSLNLALDMANKGKKVTIVDLDVVNPYFRSSDYREMLEEKGIHIIAPRYAGTNLDTPILSAEIDSVFDIDDRMIIFDVGGD